MLEGAKLGAGLINDVRALQRDVRVGRLPHNTQARHVCLMHMQGQPATMQQQPRYESVIDEV
jgi:dihydropteroate synthase